MTNRAHAHRLLQCLTVAIRPLCVEELAEVLALDFGAGDGATPMLNKDWRWEDRQRAVLSACSSLVTLVDDGDSRVIQFSHFSVKEFLTSHRISTSKHDTSHFHIRAEPAHTTLAQACLGTLLQLDDNLDNSQVEASFPLARYASQHWVEHAQFGMVSSRIEDAMQRMFDSTKPYFASWLQLHDIDPVWCSFGTYDADRGSSLYYASLSGFRDLAAQIIVEHPEQVNARGGLNHSPLAAALSKEHFEVAELLYRHGADVNVLGPCNQTPLHAALTYGYNDIVQWLLDHAANTDLLCDYDWSPMNLAAANGHLELVRMLLRHNVRFDVANNQGHTPLHRASNNGHVEIVRLLLRHGADANAQGLDYSTPLHLALLQRKVDVVHLLLSHAADVNAKNRDGRSPLHSASSHREPEIVRLLLDHGADPNATDKVGRTPLHEASSKGKELNVRLLLDHGASGDAKDEEGMTPVQLASTYEITQIFRAHGARVDGGQ